MNKTKRFLALVMAFCLSVAMMLPAFASDASGGTADPRISILKLATGYQDDGEDPVFYQYGTCFLINDEYVMTNEHVITLDEDVKQQIMSDFGLTELTSNDAHIKYYVFVSHDVKIQVTPHSGVRSSDLDFVAMKLSYKIYDRTPVVFADSDSVAINDKVYALGFPADSLSTKEYNTVEDVSSVGGEISKITELYNVDVFEHGAQLTEGNSGGPLLNENKEVIGVNVAKADNKNYAIQINYIAGILDSFGIAYTKADGSSGGGTTTETTAPDSNGTDVTETEAPIEDTPEPTEDPSIVENLKSDLEAALTDARAMADEKSKYTAESLEMLNQSINDAEQVLKTDPDEADLQKALSDLNSSMSSMAEKTGPSMTMILIIVAIAVLVIIIVVVVIVLVKGNKKSAKTNPAQNASIPPNPMQQPNQQMHQQPYPNQQQMQQNTQGAGETTVLNAGAGETTLLGGAGSAYLIRKKTGQKVTLNTASFSIGKESRRVNYCISDNTSISRVHAQIVRKGSDYYIIDQNSTNFTYVNGAKINPQQETLLRDKAIIKLSDEEFEFHIS